LKEKLFSYKVIKTLRKDTEQLKRHVERVIRKK